jgi:hypothetical protein
MALRFYSIARLMELGKAAIRGHSVLANANFAKGSDLALIVETAAKLFQGGQVAAQHVYEQLFPETADATNRERMLEEHGLDFTKDATKARGYLVVGVSTGNLYGKQIKKGWTFEFPGTAFPDGVARTYVALEDATSRPSGDHWGTATAGFGASLLKLRTRTAVMRKGDYVGRTDLGGHVGSGIVRNVDPVSRHVDLFRPICIRTVDGDVFAEGVNFIMIRAEAQEAGAQGNGSGYEYLSSGSALPSITTSGDETINIGFVLEMSGGADAVGAIDPDEDRVVRVLEDTIAGAPSGGNPQHWREIALACHDVALDDAIVYMGMRGTGSIDIVAIGHSGQLRVPEFPEANVAHLALGYNRRRIGDVQAEYVERWCKFNTDGTPRTHYYDDIKVRSIEWDWRGRYNNHYSDSEFLDSSTQLLIAVEALSGYGPDCGQLLSITPYQMDATERFSRLYPSVSGIRVHDSLRVGHRLNIVLGTAATNPTYPMATVVTEIIGIDYDRKYVVVKDMEPIARLVCPRSQDVTILSWSSAGPLDQQIDNAVHELFDELGPGSYTQVPMDPGAQSTYIGAGVASRPFPGVQLERWPDEGRRWSGAFRKSALLAKLHAIKGVKSATVFTRNLQQLVDMDAAPMQTLRVSGVLTVVTT